MNKKIKDNLIKTLTYPIILLFSLFLSIFIIFTFVLPKFSYIYLQFGDNLPLSTQILLDIKYILSKYFIFLILFFLFNIIFFNILYKKFQIFFDKILFLYIPIFSNMYKNILFYRLFLSLHLLVKSSNKFIDSLDDSKHIIQNRYFYKQIILIINSMHNGNSINKAFLDTKIFDLSTISLLKISKKSNNLEQILDDIKNIYFIKMQKSMDNFKTFLEPILVLLIASIILYLVLAIMTPIWDLATVIK